MAVIPDTIISQAEVRIDNDLGYVSVTRFGGGSVRLSAYKRGMSVGVPLTIEEARELARTLAEVVR